MGVREIGNSRWTNAVQGMLVMTMVGVATTRSLIDVRTREDAGTANGEREG